jgi:hypothetical protein
MPRRGDDSSQHWKRVQLVMKVQMGLLSAAEAARELGLTVRHYYRLEEEMLRAALGAVTPMKPGPKKKETDPVLMEAMEKLRLSERERELLRIKITHLEEIQREMVARGIGVEREKKVGGGRGKGKPRKPIPGQVPAAGALAGGGTPAQRGNDRVARAGDGAQPGHSLPVERNRRGQTEAGPEGSGPGRASGDAGRD